MELAEKLKKCRLKKQISQGDVADYLNISRQAISKWENGWTTPDLDNLRLLSRLYDISIDELLNESKTNSSETNGSSDIIECSAHEQDIEKKNSTINNEVLLFAVLSILSCILPPIGIIINVWILLKMQKEHKNNLLKILCVVCILICIYNNIIIVNNLFFQYGQGNAELIQ